MSQHAVRTALVAALAAGTLTLLTGCGGGGSDTKDSAAGGTRPTGPVETTTAVGGASQLAVPDGASEGVKKSYIVENALAVCMKKQGFTYTPHVSGFGPDAASAVDGEDYGLAKKYRQKYGFGIYAASVYPNDPALPHNRRLGKTVTDDDEKGFTPAQKRAYDAALMGPPAASKAEEKLGGCQKEAQALAYGPELSAAEEKKREDAQNEKNRENGQALNGDAQLVQLAQQFASCLTAKGITITTTQPTGMSDMVRLDLAGAMPEQHSMSKQDALPLLTKDIDIALKDLECGKDFRAAYYSKLKANPYYRADG